MDNWVYELIGYVASALVALSLMMRSVLRLRVINLFGAFCFTTYGLLIHAYPVAAVNGFIILINLYYLYEFTRAKQLFATLVVDLNSTYLRAFLDFYAHDIQGFFPRFSYTPTPRHVVWFILRDLVPVGLFIAVPAEGGDLIVELDYVIPGYRDLRPGLFLYEQQAEHFKAQGVKRLCSVAGSVPHRAYLQRVGFAAQARPDGQAWYVRAVV